MINSEMGYILWAFR